MKKVFAILIWPFTVVCWVFFTFFFRIQLRLGGEDMTWKWLGISALKTSEYKLIKEKEQCL